MGRVSSSIGMLVGATTPSHDKASVCRSNAELENHMHISMPSTFWRQF